MQIHPLLLSMAAPVAAKTARAVMHSAHHVGQDFLQTLGTLGTQHDAVGTRGRVGTQPTNPEFRTGDPLSTGRTEASQDSADRLHGKLQELAQRLRRWLAERGVERPFELKFSVDANGDAITDVVGPESSQITDLIHDDPDWLAQLSALSRDAQDFYRESSFPVGAPVKLAISPQEAWIITRPAAST